MNWNELRYQYDILDELDWKIREVTPQFIHDLIWKYRDEGRPALTRKLITLIKFINPSKDQQLSDLLFETSELYAKRPGTR